MQDELGIWDDDDRDDRDDRDAFELEDESAEDEYVLDCGLEGCLMPGYHFRHECHTVEMIEAAEADALPEPHAQSPKPAATELPGAASSADGTSEFPF